MAEIKINKLLRATNLYEEARRRYDELSKTKKELEQALAGAPEGRIHVVKNSKKVQFYLRDDKTDKSIQKQTK